MLVSSIGADELANPLNLFWGVLLLKKQAELALARSTLAWTVVRPGGLKGGAGRRGRSRSGSGSGSGSGSRCSRSGKCNKQGSNSGSDSTSGSSTGSSGSAAARAPAGNVVMAPAGTYGFPPLKRSGAIDRAQVADVCLEALVCADAEGKVVEVVAEARAPARPLAELFADVPA